MSLYTGKDYSGTSVLHLTQGVTDIGSMKSGILSNTVFHSELPYASWEKIDCTPTNIRGVPFIAISGVDADILGNGKNIYFMCANNSVIQGVQLVRNFETSLLSKKYGCWYSSYNYNNGFYQPVGYPNSGFPYFLPYWGSDLSNVSLYKLNIQNGVYQGISKPNNEILINPPNLLVRGVNLLNLKYFSPNVVNNVDTVINCAGSQFQLLNSSTPSTLSLVSNSIESSIYKDDQILFSSLAKSQINYGGYINVGTNISSSRSITLPSEAIGSIVCFYLRAVSVEAFYTGSHYMPIVMKVGSGQTQNVYTLTHYYDGTVYRRFSITTVANSGVVNFNMSNPGTWDISLTYFK